MGDDKPMCTRDSQPGNSPTAHLEELRRHRDASVRRQLPARRVGQPRHKQRQRGKATCREHAREPLGA